MKKQHQQFYFQITGMKILNSVYTFRQNQILQNYKLLIMRDKHWL